MFLGVPADFYGGHMNGAFPPQYPPTPTAYPHAAASALAHDVTAQAAMFQQQAAAAFMMSQQPHFYPPGFPHGALTAQNGSPAPNSGTTVEDGKSFAKLSPPSTNAGLSLPVTPMQDTHA